MFYYYDLKTFNETKSREIRSNQKYCNLNDEQIEFYRRRLTQFIRDDEKDNKSEIYRAINRFDDQIEEEEREEYGNYESSDEFNLY